MKATSLPNAKKVDFRVGWRRFPSAALINFADTANKFLTAQTFMLSGFSGRAGEIRTHDLLHPMQAFYQAELRPDLLADQQVLIGWGRG